MKNKFSFCYLLFLSFKISLSDGCNYKEYINNKYENLTTNETYLNGLSPEEAKQKCFSLSHPDGDKDDVCCYNSDKNECIKNNTGGGTVRDFCPDKTGIVSNNCGMAGIYQPITADACTDISLVEGFCCYIKYTEENVGQEYTSCVRTIELNKNKNSETGKISDYVKKCSINNGSGANINIKEVKCKGSSLKYFWYLIFFVLILLF